MYIENKPLKLLEIQFKPERMQVNCLKGFGMHFSLMAQFDCKQAPAISWKIIFKASGSKYDYLYFLQKLFVMHSYMYIETGRT